MDLTFVNRLSSLDKVPSNSWFDVVVFDCDVSKTLAVTFVASSPSISTIYELKGIEKDKPFYKWK